jgi:DNA-binding response OmpR family regulator
MKVLVVEDDDDKRDELAAFIDRHYTVTGLDTARSFQSGLKKILADRPDFILLDMTMPNFDRSVVEDGGRPHPFAGREILRQMVRSRVSTPVLVVTQFDRFGEESDYMTLQQLTDELARKFPNYIGAVQFKGNVDDWKPALVQAIGSRIPRKDTND